MRAGTTWSKPWRNYSSDRTRVRDKSYAIANPGVCVKCDGPVKPIITKNGAKIMTNVCGKCRKGR